MGSSRVAGSRDPVQLNISSLRTGSLCGDEVGTHGRYMDNSDDAKIVWVEVHYWCESNLDTRGV